MRSLIKFVLINIIRIFMCMCLSMLCVYCFLLLFNSTYIVKKMNVYFAFLCSV